MNGRREQLHKRMMIADPNLILNVVVPETVQRKAEEWQRGTRIALQQKQITKLPNQAAQPPNETFCSSSNAKATEIPGTSSSCSEKGQLDTKSRHPVPDHSSTQKKTPKPDAAPTNNLPVASCSETVTRQSSRKSASSCFGQERYQQSIYSQFGCTNYASFCEPTNNTMYAESFFKVCRQTNPVCDDYACVDQAEDEFPGHPRRYENSSSSFGNWYKPRARSADDSPADIVTYFSMGMTTVRKDSCPLEDCSKDRTTARLRKNKTSSVNSSLMCGPCHSGGQASTSRSRCPDSPQKTARPSCPGREGLRPRPVSSNTRPSRHSSVSKNGMRLRYRPWSNGRKSSFSDMLQDQNTCPSNRHGSRKDCHRRESQAADPVRVMKPSMWPEHRQLLDKHGDLKAAVDGVETGLEVDSQDVMLGLCQSNGVTSAEDLMDLSVKETVDFFLNMASPLGGESPVYDSNGLAPGVLEAQLWLSHASFDKTYRDCT